MDVNHNVLYKGGGGRRFGKGNDLLCCMKWGIRERETIMA